MISGKKIIAIIPARGGSRGIPKKNIINFCGKPLLAWTIMQVKNSSKVNEVYVFTDDRGIANVSKKYGAKVIDEPKELAGDFSPSENALKYAIEEIRKKDEKEIDYVIFLQATSPLRETKDIDNAIDKIISEKADSLFSGAELGDFYIWKKIGDQLESVNYDYKNRKRRQDFGKQFVESGSIYIFKPGILFRYNNRFGGKIAVSEMEVWKSFEIDDYDGLQFCKELFKLKKLHLR
ncbi:MAG: acylneuraminate cytidylyltransferase family protein [bacterium]